MIPRLKILIQVFNQASLAQSVEHQTFNLRAAGSSPAGGLWFHSVVVITADFEFANRSSNLRGTFSFFEIKAPVAQWIRRQTSNL